MRKTVVFLVVSIAIVAALWSAAWFAAATFAGRKADDFIAAEARLGRDWTCPDRHVGGFPFALTLTCHDATYAGQAMGQGVEGRVAGVAATVSLAQWSHVAIVLAPPFAYKSSDGQTTIGGTWNSLTVDLASLPDPRTLVINGSDLVVQGRMPGQDDATSRIAAVSARFTASPPQPDRTVDFKLSIAGAPMPVLDDLVGGGSAPVDASVAGQLDQADPGDARTPEEAMERWRRNGGTVAFSDIAVRRGAASVTASGAIDLDDRHRLHGKLDAAFVGLEPILQRYGIGGDVAALGSLIGTLFGGPRPPKAAAPGALSLPISFGNGRLAVGPITTAVELPPLY